MEDTQNGVSGHYVKSPVGAPQSTEPEHVLTLPPLRMGTHALETHFKQNWNAHLHAQVSYFSLPLNKTFQQNILRGSSGKKNCSLLNSLAYSGLSDSKDDARVTGMRKYERVIWEKGAMHSNFLPFHFRVCALSILQTQLSRNLEQTPPMIIVCFFIPFVYLLIKKKKRLNHCFNFSQSS